MAISPDTRLLHHRDRIAQARCGSGPVQAQFDFCVDCLRDPGLTRLGGRRLTSDPIDAVHHDPCLIVPIEIAEDTRQLHPRAAQSRIGSTTGQAYRPGLPHRQEVAAEFRRTV